MYKVHGGAQTLERVLPVQKEKNIDVFTFVKEMHFTGKV